MAWIHCARGVPSLDVFCIGSFDPSHWPEAVAVDGCVYVFGYRCVTESQGMEVIIFNTEDYSWRNVRPPRRATGDHDSWAPTDFMTYFVVAHGHVVYICGKDDEYFRTDVLHCFDTRTLRWSRVQTSGRIPEGASCICACAVEDKVLVCADRAEGVPQSEPCVFTLDMQTLEWKYLCSGGFPHQYWPRGAAAFGKKVYVLLAKYCSAGRDRDLVAVFDTVTEKWEELGARGKKKPFFGLDWVLFAGSEYMYVTLNLSNPRCTDFKRMFPNIVDQHGVVLRYSLARNTWQQVTFRGKPPIGYIDAICVIDTKAYVFCFDEREMHILDLAPTLRTLCLKAVCDNDLDASSLPEVLKKDVAKLRRKQCWKGFRKRKSSAPTKEKEAQASTESASAVPHDDC